MIWLNVFNVVNACEIDLTLHYIHIIYKYYKIYTLKTTQRKKILLKKYY